MTEEVDYFARMRARRAKRIRIAARIGALLLGAAFIIWGPGWMIGRASKSYTACSNADYEAGPNPRTDCTSGKAWLLFPKIVPWKRAEAVAMSKSIDADAAERKLKLATTFAPDPAGRDAAVKEVMANVKPDALGSILGSKGVGWAVRDRKKELVSSAAQASFLRQLVAHGDIDDAIAFAKDAPPLETEDYGARELYLKRGALVCLAGDPTFGKKLVHDAIRVHAIHHDFAYTQARIGLAACGEITHANKDDLDVNQLRSFMLGSSLKGGELLDGIAGRDYDWFIHGHVSPLVAAAIAEQDRPLERMLQIAAAFPSAPEERVTLWSWENGMSTEPVLLDPEVHEKAAGRLEAMIAGAPQSQPETDDFSLSVETGPVYRQYHKQPKDALRHVARGLWIEAAGAWSAQHQCDRAETAARHAHGLVETPSERIQMASALIACDRWEFAAELAQDASSSSSLATALLLAIRAQALAHAGKYGEARAIAKTAYERVEPKEPTGNPLAELSDAAFVRAATSYLFLALALKTKDMTGAPSIETPTIYEGEKMSWDVLALKPESERAVLRWRMFDYDGPLYSAARPAELFVVGSVAPDAGVEVWLDKAAFTWAAGKEGRMSMRARAEAARWRGDSAAEAEWLRRAANIEKLALDPKKAILARIAGL